MGDFGETLMALLTFSWLRDRHDSVGNVDNWSVMLAPKGQCEYCSDTVYFDTFAVEWQHLSSRQVLRQGHKASPVDEPKPPVDHRLERRRRLAAVNAEIASLIASSERLALARIPEEDALNAMDSINGKIESLAKERDTLQIADDLQTARDVR